MRKPSRPRPAAGASARQAVPLGLALLALCGCRREAREVRLDPPVAAALHRGARRLRARVYIGGVVPTTAENLVV